MTDANGNIEEYNHYHPYGALMNISSASTQPYKYNGKELNRLNRLLWYDQSARQYNPILGRFMSMDPLCEKYYSISPYAFCANNPVNRVDLHGDSIIFLDNTSIEALYNALPNGIKLSMEFRNGILIPKSIEQICSESQDLFLKDLYEISINPQMVEIKTTNTNEYYMDNRLHNDEWNAPEDIDYAKEWNNGIETIGYPAGKTITGVLGQTLYPRTSGELKTSINNNIRININEKGNLIHRACGMAHEFAHTLLYLQGKPHSHTDNGKFIYGRQWNVMKRFGYDYVDF